MHRKLDIKSLRKYVHDWCRRPQHGEPTFGGQPKSSHIRNALSLGVRGRGGSGEVSRKGGVVVEGTYVGEGKGG